MKDLGGPSRISRQDHLLSFLTTEFDDAPYAYGLFDEFLRHETYSKCFCQKLLAVSKQRAGAQWDIRRLAILMLEHQILRIHPGNLDEFDFLFTELNLKEAPGLNTSVVSSVLKEGYSTTNLRRFIPEFRRRLERLNRVHAKIKGRRTTQTGLRDFIELSRHDCKLSLARYLFTAEEVVDEILSQLQVTDGAKDLDPSAPLFVEAEAEQAIDRLPDFEAGILRRLCASSHIYWVSDVTNSEVNSLVEYPLTTVVLAIKPPGSDSEFEIKRAGRKGPYSLRVVYARDGYALPPSHRLDGGNMQWLLRHEAKAASKVGLIYRLVQGTEAPIANYISRSTIYSVPVSGSEVQTLTYFTEPRIFEDGFREMRTAMTETVAAFTAEGYAHLPDLPGDLGLTAQFISIVAPAQAILSGTSSFRLDKLATYLSNDGPQRYFEEGLNIGYSRHDARRFADAILEEVLGTYEPPNVRYQTHNQYLTAAFCFAENRTRADTIYLSLLQQLAGFWGTLLGVKGYSRGESFVARNVGLKSYWDGGQWKVKIIFMDHDAVVIPGHLDKDFYVQDAVGGMRLDELHIWGRSGPSGSTLGAADYLRSIYRISDDLNQKGQSLARIALRKAYQKTQRQFSSNPKLRALFGPEFAERLVAWNALVRSYLLAKPEIAASPTWREKKREMLAAKGYAGDEFDAYVEAIENNRDFLERQSFLFAAEGQKDN